MDKDVAVLRAKIDTAKRAAMNKFAADWGTRDVGIVMGALSLSIPGSASAADAARKALAITAAKLGR